MNRTTDVTRRRKTVYILSFVLVLALMGLIGYYIMVPLVRHLENPEAFRQMVENEGFLGKLLMILFMMLQVIIALVPGEVFEVGAGYAFGGLEGTLLCLIGILLGSALIFLAVKKWGMQFVELFFDTRKIREVSFLKNAKKRNLLTFMLFLIPGTPKDLITYFVGLTDMKLSTFLLFSLPARLPSLLTSTLTGGMLGEKNYPLAAALYAITGVITLFCIFKYRRISKEQQSAQDDINALPEENTHEQ